MHVIAPPEPNVKKIQRGEALVAGAKAARKAAGMEREAAFMVCARKVLENDCRAQAQREYLEKIEAERRQASEGRALIREGRLSERDARRAGQAEAAVMRAEQDARRVHHQAAVAEREARYQKRLEKKAEETQRRAAKSKRATSRVR
jgi:hypothetical protein